LVPLQSPETTEIAIGRARGFAAIGEISLV